MTRSCPTVLSATHISMPNLSSLSMSMSEQRTSRRKFGIPTTFRKIGLPIKSLHTRKLDQSNRNRHNPRTSVRGLSLHPQQHQLHNELLGHVRTRITLTCSTTRGLSQRRHLARAALGHSTVQVVLNKSSRGGGRGVDFMCSEGCL